MGERTRQREEKREERTNPCPTLAKADLCQQTAFVLLDRTHGLVKSVGAGVRLPAV